jgi:hypothetical protein
MAETATTKRCAARATADRPEPAPPPILPVCDTVSGHKAAHDPAGAVRHYERLADQLWLPPRVRELADRVLGEVRTGHTCWASLSGPYGYGKTAAGVAAWCYARGEGFTAIPPLSCSNFDELAHGVAALATALYPRARVGIDRLFRRVWERGLDDAVEGDSRRYQLPARAVRRLLQDKMQAGQLILDGQCHRLVEFLSELGRLATRWSQGLFVVVDELQQLLGPLDTRAVVQFREFVWGLRTEQSPCGVVVCLDTMLEARLARWAADLLHRIRESGPTLQLTDVYTRDFPSWLWERLTTSNGLPARADGRSLSQEVLRSLGQFVERPDLANGPRTVVDVFTRAINRFGDSSSPYGIGDLVADLHGGVFRYFGEGAPVQRALTELLKDDWLRADQDRATLVCTLAAFPRGCPLEIATEAVGSARRLAKVRTELFGPLLVELPEGLALERLQQVRRLIADWEHVLARCWDTLPSQDSLLAHAPDMIWRVLAARLFPEAPGSEAHWERTSDDSVAALTDWRYLRGSFDNDFPLREVSLWIGAGEPSCWPEEVDLAVALVCDRSPKGEAAATLDVSSAVPRVTLRLPLLRPLEEYVPPELERYRKYLQPEPFRPLTILAAVHELEAVAGRAAPDGSDEAASELRAFVDVVVAFLLREIVQGEVNLGPRQRVKQRGIELVRALFSAACRSKYPEYCTLIVHQNWNDLLAIYRGALQSESISDIQRQGEAVVEGGKATLLRTLFKQKSAAAGDSLLRTLGPLVECSGSAEAISLRLSLHPGETAALEYLRRTGRRRAVPPSAVQETLRHYGYLPAEAEALVGLLTDRGLIAVLKGGLRPLIADRTEREQALREIEALSARLATLRGANEVPEVPKDGSLRDLWAHLDLLQQMRQDSLAALSQRVENKGERMREMLGGVRAENIPSDWVKSDVAAHLRGIAKLLGRTRDALMRGLQREAGHLDEELTRAGADGEEWAIGWHKRVSSFERVWGELEKRVVDFLAQAAALRAWVSLNERLASLTAVGHKVGASDPALARSVRELAAELRERFATDHWAPLLDYADVAARLSALESQAQGLLFSRVQAYLGELDTLRIRFNDFLSGPAPQLGVPDGLQTDKNVGPNFARLYAWALQGFVATAERLRGRRGRGQAWRHPTRKSQSWADIDGQMSRALMAASSSSDFTAVTRLGELLLLMRQGFVVAAAERGEIVYEGEESAGDLPELSSLLADGLVRVHVEWV